MATTDPKAGAKPGEDQFLDQMSHELAGWRDPFARLRQALDRDELQLYCQPILALRPPGGFVMAEVLVRLREEEALMLPPGDFLPVFEHFGMMPELDRWVVSQWCGGGRARGRAASAASASTSRCRPSATRSFPASSPPNCAP